MTPAREPEGPPADFEVAGGLKAGRATWGRTGRVETRTTGDVETEELRAREPEEPQPGRPYRNARLAWRLRARLIEVTRDVMRRSAP
jgi:hypothetical protein